MSLRGSGVIITKDRAASDDDIGPSSHPVTVQVRFAVFEVLDERERGAGVCVNGGGDASNL